MTKGKFIAFEGLDGSGSSTHISLLHTKLEEMGMKVAKTKEPTNNMLGGMIKGVLTKQWKMSPHGLQLLFAADRAHHLSRFIEPNLENGIHVLTDRYMYSTIAFGGSALNDIQWLKDLNKYFRVPDLVILLKVDPKECIDRIEKGRTEIELFEEVEKLEKVWKVYEDLSEENDNFVIIDAMRDINEVAADVFNAVQKVI